MHYVIPQAQESTISILNIFKSLAFYSILEDYITKELFVYRSLHYLRNIFVKFFFVG